MKELNTVEDKFRQEYLQQKNIEISELDKQSRYQEALDLAEDLYKRFPSEQKSLPNLGILKRKIKLHETYSKALIAIQNNDYQKAQDMLVEVITLEPAYKDSIRYLYLAVKNLDIETISLDLKKSYENNETLQSKLVEIESNNETLQSKLVEIESNNETLQSKLVEIESDNETLQSKLVEIESNNEILQSKLVEIESDNNQMSNKIINLNQEIKTYSKNHSFLKKSEEDKITQINELNKKLEYIVN